MKIFICGQKLFGQSVLDALIEDGHDVLGVSAPLEARVNISGVDRLRERAIRLGIPCMDAGTLRAESLPEDTDLIVAAHSHDFIGRATRTRSRLGAVGYHPSLLPLHRGRDAVRWTIRMGDRVAGGSVYWLSDSMDGGDIAAQDYCFVRRDDTAESLWRRELFPMGVRLLRQAVSDLSQSIMIRIPQDHTLSTWEPSMDRPPVFRPELPQLGCVDGFSVIRSRSDPRLRPAA